MSKKLLTKNEIRDILETLQHEYPAPQCGLEYTTPFELMLSLILAAQCTDIRVNHIRPILTNKYPTPENILEAGISNVYNIIKSCSFPNNKAKHIVSASEILITKFNGQVPDTMQELTTIPGIGRKSANIILAECFNKIEGIAVDTHVTRLSKKIGFTNSADVLIIEKDLMKKIPKDLWGKINHTLVTHGKTICTARTPKCSDCVINSYCRYYKSR
ncbi:MAG: endonuclease III [Clostridia bacterium]|nr:endonuclease III [Clostridia bacterium]